MLKPIHTYFDRNAQPSNLLTHSEWRRFGNHGFTKPVGWKTAMRRWAEDKGGAMLWRADDSLIVITKLANGKLRQTTYKPGTWSWDKSQVVA
jgi:hypothetical protein